MAKVNQFTGEGPKCDINGNRPSSSYLHLHGANRRSWTGGIRSSSGTGLDTINGIPRLCFETDGLVDEGFDKEFHSTAETAS